MLLLFQCFCYLVLLDMLGYQSQAPGSENPPRLSSLSSNSSLLRPESLGVVMSEAQRLLHGQVTAALTVSCTFSSLLTRSFPFLLS